MKITLIGASGFVGSALLTEFLSRGHHVTAIARDISRIDTNNKLLETNSTDVLNSEQLEDIIKNSEAVVSAFNAGWSNPNIFNDFLNAYRSIQKSGERSRGETLYRYRWRRFALP